MKKYESPTIDIISLETSDIIATSEDGPDVLNLWGSQTSNVNSNDFNVFG